MAVVSRSSDFKSLFSLFSKRKIMPLNSYWTLIVLIFTVSQCFSDDDHEMEEFLKREYSLSKPYQGNVTHSVNGLGGMLLGEGQMFLEKKRI